MYIMEVYHINIFQQYKNYPMNTIYNTFTGVARTELFCLHRPLIILFICKPIVNPIEWFNVHDTRALIYTLIPFPMFCRNP